jgi:hypothetical protein
MLHMVKWSATNHGVSSGCVWLAGLLGKGSRVRRVSRVSRVSRVNRVSRVSRVSKVCRVSTVRGSIEQVGSVGLLA